MLEDLYISLPKENIRKEVCRNLSELYALNGDEAKAEEFRKMSE